MKSTRIACLALLALPAASYSCPSLAAPSDMWMAQGLVSLLAFAGLQSLRSNAQQAARRGGCPGPLIAQALLLTVVSAGVASDALSTHASGLGEQLALLAAAAATGVGIGLAWVGFLWAPMLAVGGAFRWAFGGEARPHFAYRRMKAPEPRD